MKFSPTILFSLLKAIFWLLIAFLIHWQENQIIIYIATTYKTNSILYFTLLKLVFIGISVYIFLNSILETYELTNEQLTIQKGVFSIKKDYLELYRIKDITLLKPFLLRLIGVFIIRLHTSDKTHPIMVIKGINIKDLDKKLRQLVEEQRKIKNVYEID